MQTEVSLKIENNCKIHFNINALSCLPYVTTVLQSRCTMTITTYVDFLIEVRLNCDKHERMFDSALVSYVK